MAVRVSFYSDGFVIGLFRFRQFVDISLDTVSSEQVFASSVTFRCNTSTLRSRIFQNSAVYLKIYIMSNPRGAVFEYHGI